MRNPDKSTLEGGVRTRLKIVSNLTRCNSTYEPKHRKKNEKKKSQTPFIPGILVPDANCALLCCSWVFSFQNSSDIPPSYTRRNDFTSPLRLIASCRSCRHRRSRSGSIRGGKLALLICVQQDRKRAWRPRGQDQQAQDLVPSARCQHAPSEGSCS